MKKYIAIALVLVLVLAVLTVPKQNDYASWMKNRIKQEADNVLMDWGVELVGDRLIRSTSSCANYVVLSLCETKVTEQNKFRAIGAFHQFIALGRIQDLIRLN
ncbi:hypothetical protein ABU162_16870 [Paenibacillus thiaminolyticus]|uniref:hypothetical protein n=1 Tax=Paenibacillus thiaminolyticus TaxID=49283 RepID=UPI0035A64104